MANLLDYISWRGDLSFSKSPFNKLDALILSQITYILWDDVAPEKFKEPVPLKQLAKNFRKLPDFEERQNIGFLINERTTELMFEAADSDRFKDVKVCGFRNIFSEKNVEQFAAITYLVEDNVIVSYRGTDDTIIGFEEDFQIAYKDQIPAQKDGLEYFYDVCRAFPRSKYIFVGHSKGGNIAVNTAVLCDKKAQKRIEKVFNFDGPGFSYDFFRKDEYEEIKSRIFSFYPQLSVVGMLFHHDGNYEIVESSNFAIMQHDVLSWHVTGSNFVNKDDFTDECKFFEQTFNNWVDKLSPEMKKQFVNSLFSLIKASGYKTNSEIEKNALQASARIIAAYATMDQKKKEAFKDIFSLLISTVKSELPIFKFLKSPTLAGPKKG